GARGSPNEPLEAPEGEVVSIDSQRIAAAPGLDPLAPDCLPELRDIPLQEVARRLGWIVAPDVVDEAARRDNLACVDEKGGENRALPSSAEWKHAPVFERLERPEDPELDAHASTVAPFPAPFQPLSRGRAHRASVATDPKEEGSRCSDDRSWQGSGYSCWRWELEPLSRRPRKRRTWVGARRPACSAPAPTRPPCRRWRVTSADAGTWTISRVDLTRAGPCSALGTSTSSAHSAARRGPSPRPSSSRGSSAARRPLQRFTGAAITRSSEEPATSRARAACCSSRTTSRQESAPTGVTSPCDGSGAVGPSRRSRP